VFDVYEGDHMSMQGGLMIKNDVSDYYRELLTVIEGLDRDKTDGFATKNG